MVDWKAVAEENGISLRTFRERVKKLGWTPEEAAKTPLWTKIKKREREYEKWLQIANQNGISYNLFRQRIYRYDWSPEKSATEPVKRKRDDNKWRVKARENGISNAVYYHRVDEMFWSPEKASSTPITTRKEASKLANDAKAEYREIVNERIFNDEENMFKLTPLHFEIAEKNGIKKGTVNSRVYRDGLTVQDAITMPLKEPEFTQPEGYLEYLKIAKKNGISRGTYRERVKRGWPLEKAATKEPSLSNPTRSDIEWIDLAASNGITRSTYDGRVNAGWIYKQAATTPVLKKGEYLNEKTQEKASEAFKKFRKR